MLIVGLTVATVIAAIVVTVRNKKKGKGKITKRKKKFVPDKLMQILKICSLATPCMVRGFFGLEKLRNKY